MRKAARIHCVSHLSLLLAVHLHLSNALRLHFPSLSCFARNPSLVKKVLTQLLQFCVNILKSEFSQLETMWLLCIILPGCLVLCYHAYYF